MDTTKKVVIFAVCGFVLSFLVGLFSSVSFGIILLRAIVSALIFAGLYYALSIIFKRYLVDNTETVGQQAGTESIIPQRGQLIDIKLEDEFLPEEENAPLFKIPKELMPNKDNDSESATGVFNNVETSASMQPSMQHEQPSDEKLFAAPTKVTDNTNDIELGSLPDMDSMLSDMQGSPTSEVITTSDFANSEEMVVSGELRDAEKEIMAKAIHMVLARDNN